MSEIEKPDIFPFAVNPEALAISSQIKKDLLQTKPRLARCSTCLKSEIPSHETLPLFRSKPDQFYDEYFCGCFAPEKEQPDADC